MTALMRILLLRKLEVKQELKSQPFSLLIDGSSDIHGGKYCALLVRYLAYKASKLITRLISVIENE